MWPDAQIQASSDDGGVLRQTPTCSTIPVASQAVRVALEREFPCARPTIADPSGSDSDAPLVSWGRFAALSDDMTVLVKGDGAPRRQCATTDGAALAQARRRKEFRHPELTGEHGRDRLVVLACETGGRWSEEAHNFLRQLARARARSEPGDPCDCKTRLVQAVVHSDVLLPIVQFLAPLM